MTLHCAPPHNTPLHRATHRNSTQQALSVTPQHFNPHLDAPPHSATRHNDNFPRLTARHPTTPHGTKQLNTPTIPQP